MLKITNQKHFDDVMAFAEKIGKKDQLEEKLQYLGNFACHKTPEETHCYLYSDFAPYSFEFTMLKKAPNGEYVRWFNGGLIFHGPHDRGGDGGGPTFSVSLAGSQEARWEIHT